MTLGPQFQQLKMFMTGNEIKQSITGSVDAPDADDDNDNDVMAEMWDQKVDESHYRRADPRDDVHGQSLYDNVDEEGARMPVTMFHPRSYMYSTGSMIHGDGHHRTAISADVEDRTGRQIYIPVLHDAHDPMYTSAGNLEYRQGQSTAARTARKLGTPPPETFRGLT